MVRLIWCADRKHGIGKNNALPWKNPEEMEHFKKTTANKVVVMGYNTYLSIGKLLENRTNVIMTKRHKDAIPARALSYQTAKSVLRDFAGVDVFVIGGKATYELFWEFADELIVSRLPDDYKCDVRFDPDLSGFDLVDAKKHKTFEVFFYRKKNLSAPGGQPDAGVFNLSFSHFCGPLDLLLALIQEKKMDLLNLDLAELTAQYLAFIRAKMQDADVEQITDYLVMATYLIELKSKRIIPAADAQSQDDVDLSDNRERDRLVRHLIEYKHYREVIPKLEELQLTRSQMYGKETDEWNAFQISGADLPEAPLPNYVSPDRLLAAMQRVFARLRNKAANRPEIVIQELSVEQVQDEIFAIVSAYPKKRMSLSDLLAAIDPAKMSMMYFVTCFVALLVLTRYQKIDLFQDRPDGEIYIELNRRPETSEPEETIEQMIKRQEDFKRETEEYRKQILKQRAEEYRKKREEFLKQKLGAAYVPRDQYLKMKKRRPDGGERPPKRKKAGTKGE